MSRSSLILLTLAGCIIFSSCPGSNERPVTIGYLVIGDSLSAEDKAALEWLENHRSFIPEMIDSGYVNADRRDVDVYWVHIPDSSVYARWAAEKENTDFLGSLFGHGARFLLTDYAALLPYEIGLESRRPDVRTLHIEDDWNFDKKGLQGWRGHPAFDGLFGGAFIWDGCEDHDLTCIGYFDGVFPVEGKVAAVEKSYITIHRDRRLMVEHQSGKSRSLSVGAFVYFSRVNRLQYRLRRFIENSLFYLSGETAGLPVTYWKDYDYRPREVQVYSKPLAASSKRRFADSPRAGLLMEKESRGNNFYDVAGRRALVMGRENGGIDEVWVHPLRILRDYEAGIVQGDSIAWFRHMDGRVEIRPESLTRRYRSARGEIREIIFPSLEMAGAVVHYEAYVSEEIQLVIKLRSDLRWMWPFDEYALGGICYGYDGALGALRISDETGDFACVFGGDSKPGRHLEGAFSGVVFEDGRLRGAGNGGNQVYHAALFSLKEGNGYCLNYAVAGTNQGADESLSDYRALLENPHIEYTRLSRHYDRLLHSCVTIESPDGEFNRLWKWALVGTDRFFVHTPPLGRALVAGYATTARGWRGGHENSGRPGYGWYFGRDAEWSCFAIDDYGDFETVRSQLQFLQKFQDDSGKIFHELSTSGVVHYDAADATPLYVILAAHYLRASGDLEFVKDGWTHLERAMDFLYSTDTDGDLLIENTNVGHGWVEGGKLWGANTTFYLAGLWAQALRDAAYMASHLGKTGLSGRYARDSESVRHILNTDFWNEPDRFFHYGKFTDGSYNPEKTVLPATVMYFNLLDDEKARAVLSEYAGNGFTSDWGVRILSSRSPLFNPRGYHYGSVWPLYTGWTALAEYEYGNSVQGFTHIFNNLAIKNHWASGFVEEVMNGAEYRPSGVCPHQCWSETNVLHPAITGMIGWKPHALEGKAELRPRFPLAWDSVTVNNLRVAGSRLKLEMIRARRETKYILSLTRGGSVAVCLSPEIPEGMVMEKIEVQGRPIDFSAGKRRGLLAEPIVFKLDGEVTVILGHRGGVGMIPLMPGPEPGDVSKGYRIIDARLEGEHYIMDLEGRSGTEGSFSFRVFDWRVSGIDGGRIEDVSSSGIVTMSVPFPESTEEYVGKQVRVTLE